MRKSTIAWVAGFALLVVTMFLAGRSRPRRQTQLPTPETGGEAAGIRPGGHAASPARPARTVSARSERRPRRRGRPHKPQQAKRRARTYEQARQPLTAEPERVAEQTYRNDDLKLAVEKPRTTDWVLADARTNFRGVPHRNKVLEIRRVPRDRSGGFAIIDGYVVEMPEGASEADVAERIEKLGGFTKWAELGRFTVDEERAVEIGGCPMTRRIVRLAFKGNESTYISVRAVRNGKLYLFVGFTDSEHFDALLPEFEQTISSLRIG